MLHSNHMLAIALVLSALGAAEAGASAQRTFVASYGLTANAAFNCSIAKPCRAFSEALGVTSSGGEVIVLDSAGYGPVTITQPVSIIAAPGVYAGVSVSTGNGITVNGASIKVTLRGLQINGQGGASGIFVQQAGEVRIEDCTISNMGDNGVDTRAANSKTYVSNTVINSNANSGIYADAFSGPVALVVHRARLEGNQWGLFVRQGAQATVSQTSIDNNSQVGILSLVDNASAPSPNSRVAIESSTFDGNAVGVHAKNTLTPGAGSTIIHVSRSTIRGSSGPAAWGESVPAGVVLTTVIWLVSDTITGNAAAFRKNGSYIYLNASTITENAAHQMGSTAGGGFYTLSNNAIEIDPLLVLNPFSPQ